MEHSIQQIDVAPGGSCRCDASAVDASAVGLWVSLLVAAVLLLRR